MASVDTSSAQFKLMQVILQKGTPNQRCKMRRDFENLNFQAGVSKVVCVGLGMLGAIGMSVYPAAGGTVALVGMIGAVVAHDVQVVSGNFIDLNQEESKRLRNEAAQDSHHFVNAVLKDTLIVQSVFDVWLAEHLKS